MSLRDILDKVKGLTSRLSDLTADVEDLKKKDQAHQKMKKVDNRSRSRSPRSGSRERASQHSGERCSQTMRKESLLGGGQYGGSGRSLGGDSSSSH